MSAKAYGWYASLRSSFQGNLESSLPHSHCGCTVPRLWYSIKHVVAFIASVTPTTCMESSRRITLSRSGSAASFAPR